MNFERIPYSSCLPLIFTVNSTGFVARPSHQVYEKIDFDFRSVRVGFPRNVCGES